MGPKVIVVSVVVLLGIWLSLFTQQSGVRTPPVGEASESEGVSDPGKREEVVHLLETHGIRIGDATDNDIIVNREGEKIRIEITEKFLSEVPENFIATIGWTRPTNWVSEEGYSEFLESMHTFLIEEMPEEHGHSHDEHGHEHDGHEHEH